MKHTILSANNLDIFLLHFGPQSDKSTVAQGTIHGWIMQDQVFWSDAECCLLRYNKMFLNHLWIDGLAVRVSVSFSTGSTEANKISHVLFEYL